MAAKKKPKKVAKKRRPAKGRKTAPKMTAKQMMSQLVEVYKDEDDVVGSLGSELILPPVRERLPTGSIALDRLIGGGWPVGRIIEVAAWEHVGKSTLLDQAIAECQRVGGIAHVIDTEYSRQPEYSAMLGVDPDTCITAQRNSLEDVFEYIDRVLDIQEQAVASRTERPVLIVWDSLGGTPARAELEGEADDKHVMLGARIIKQNFRRICGRLAHSRTTLIFANHFYQRPGIPGLVTPGGSGIKFFCALRLWLKLPQNPKLKIGEVVVGHRVEAQPKKSRVSKPQPPSMLGLIYGAGFHNAYTLYEWGLTAPNSEGNYWVNNVGKLSWLYPPGAEPISWEKRWLGFGQVLVANPDLYGAMVAQYMAEAEEDDDGSEEA
jgi:protein RecA